MKMVSWGSSEPVARYYGWVDFEASDHFPPYGDCHPIIPEEATIKEETHQQFQGTFYEGDESCTFLVAAPVECACGKLTGLRWAYEGSIGAVITGVLNEG